MLDTLKRMFCDVRPFDVLMLVVEVLVLALIAYEVGSGIWHRIRRHRRSKRVYDCFVEGQALQADAPRRLQPPNEEAINDWKRRTVLWRKATTTLLIRYSSQAAASFLHDSGQFGSLPFILDMVEGAARADYLRLQEQLNNLRSIMERPEVYF